jgi:hypothetical protein
VIKKADENPSFVNLMASPTILWTLVPIAMLVAESPVHPSDKPGFISQYEQIADVWQLFVVG